MLIMEDQISKLFSFFLVQAVAQAALGNFHCPWSLHFLQKSVHIVKI